MPTAYGFQLLRFGQISSAEDPLLILDREPLPGGGRAADLLLPRIEDEILRGDLAASSRFRHAVFFSISTQKSDAIGGDRGSPVLECS